jgi:hypothetical protein
MNTERLFNIVMGELSIDKLKLESELETAINSTDDVEAKIMKIKSILARISTIENSIAKFSNLINNNNNIQKEN